MASEIRIVGMNGNSVDPVFNTKLYRYSFRLSETPEYDWKMLYDQTARDVLVQPSRRPSSIVNDTIIVEMSADENKQQQLDYQKQLVAEVNRKYDAAQEAVARDLAAKAQQKQIDEAEIQRLRAEANNLEF